MQPAALGQPDSAADARPDARAPAAGGVAAGSRSPSRAPSETEARRARAGAAATSTETTEPHSENDPPPPLTLPANRERRFRHATEFPARTPSTEPHQARSLSCSPWHPTDEPQRPGSDERDGAPLGPPAEDRSRRGLPGGDEVDLSCLPAGDRRRGERARQPRCPTGSGWTTSCPCPAAFPPAARRRRHDLAVSPASSPGPESRSGALKSGRSRAPSIPCCSL